MSGEGCVGRWLRSKPCSSHQRTGVAGVRREASHCERSRGGGLGERGGRGRAGESEDCHEIAALRLWRDSPGKYHFSLSSHRFKTINITCCAEQNDKALQIQRVRACEIENRDVGKQL